MTVNLADIIISMPNSAYKYWSVDGLLPDTNKQIALFSNKQIKIRFYVHLY